MQVHALSVVQTATKFKMYREALHPTSIARKIEVLCADFFYWAHLLMSRTQRQSKQVAHFQCMCVCVCDVAFPVGIRPSIFLLKTGVDEFSV